MVHYRCNVHLILAFRIMLTLTGVRTRACLNKKLDTRKICHKDGEKGEIVKHKMIFNENYIFQIVEKPFHAKNDML